MQEFITHNTEFEGGYGALREFLRNEKKQKEWFNILKDQTIKNITNGLPVHRLYLIAVDLNEFADDDDARNLQVRNVLIDIRQFCNPYDPVYTFRDAFRQLQIERFQVMAACVTARLWMPERNEKVSNQVVFLAETKTARDFTIFDVFEKIANKPTITGDKSVKMLYGEAHDRFRNMLYRKPKSIDSSARM